MHINKPAYELHRGYMGRTYGSPTCFVPISTD